MSGGLGLTTGRTSHEQNLAVDRHGSGCGDVDRCGACPWRCHIGNDSVAAPVTAGRTTQDSTHPLARFVPLDAEIPATHPGMAGPDGTVPTIKFIPGHVARPQSADKCNEDVCLHVHGDGTYIGSWDTTGYVADGYLCTFATSIPTMVPAWLPRPMRSAAVAPASSIHCGIRIETSRTTRSLQTPGWTFLAGQLA